MGWAVRNKECLSPRSEDRDVYFTDAHSCLEISEHIHTAYKVFEKKSVIFLCRTSGQILFYTGCPSPSKIIFPVPSCSLIVWYCGILQYGDWVKRRHTGLPAAYILTKAERLQRIAGLEPLSNKGRNTPFILSFVLRPRQTCPAKNTPRNHPLGRRAEILIPEQVPSN